MTAWKNFSDTLPNFGDVIFCEDNYGRFAVVKVIEGDQDEYGNALIDFEDQDGDYIDDIEIVRWVLLKDIFPKETHAP